MLLFGLPASHAGSGNFGLSRRGLGRPGGEPYFLRKTAVGVQPGGRSLVGPRNAGEWPDTERSNKNTLHVLIEGEGAQRHCLPN